MTREICHLVVSRNVYFLFCRFKMPRWTFKFLQLFLQLFGIVIRHLKRQRYPRWLEWCHFRLCRARWCSAHVTRSLICGQLFVLLCHGKDLNLGRENWPRALFFEWTEHSSELKMLSIFIMEHTVVWSITLLLNVLLPSSNF